MAVSWAVGPANSRLVRGLLYLAYGSFGGVLVFVGVVVLAVFGPALDRPFRDWRDMLPVVVGLLLLALIRSRSFAVLRTEDTAPDDLLAAFAAHRRPSLLVVVSVCCGALFFLGLRLGHWGGLAYILFGVGCFVGAQVLSADGEIDLEAGTVLHRRRTAELDHVTGLRRLDLGPHALVWFAYQRGRSTSTSPRLVVVPPSIADRLAEAVAATDTVSPGEVDTTTRRVLIGGGLFWYLLAAGFVLALRAEGGQAARAAPVLVLVLGLFGTMFLWAAYVETG
ncbi:hypothetical protein [Halorientalis pallida]|uniref:PH domain-containing protein n=1 Tax=Halorientalis pallida TaxID=2479928 RepID=A0A498L5M4_9EURY|nr:hypothetical protein [Halorientalis pallida]RXK49985.1 hypothetical protein EAF64_05285 [Halorientalis pallida]